MMKIKTLFGIIALIGTLIAYGIGPSFSFVGPDEFNQVVSATDANTAISFGFKARDVLIINDGADEVFVTLGSTIATLTKFELKVGEAIGITLESPTEGMGLICNSAETATVRVIAWR